MCHVQAWPAGTPPLPAEDAAEQPLCSFCRNKDFQEVTLEKSGEVLLRFAAAYGFRNLQNVVLKLKKGRLPFHFVEVLACAGGKAPRPPGKRPACPPRASLSCSAARGADAARVTATQPSLPLPLAHPVRKGQAPGCPLGNPPGSGVPEKSLPGSTQGASLAPGTHGGWVPPPPPARFCPRVTAHRRHRVNREGWGGVPRKDSSVEAVWVSGRRGAGGR